MFSLCSFSVYLFNRNHIKLGCKFISRLFCLVSFNLVIGTLTSNSWSNNDRENYSIISAAWTFELFATSLTSEFELMTINYVIRKIGICFTLTTRNLTISNCNFAFCKFCKVLCIDLESKLFNWENDCRNSNSVSIKLIQINSNAVSKIRWWSEKLKKKTHCI